MRNVTQNNTTVGFPVLGILGTVFVLAKVFEIGPIAEWSWWWVLAPFWAGLAIFLAAGALLLVGAFIAVLLDR